MKLCPICETPMIAERIAKGKVTCSKQCGQVKASRAMTRFLRSCKYTPGPLILRRYRRKG